MAVTAAQGVLLEEPAPGGHTASIHNAELLRSSACPAAPATRSLGRHGRGEEGTAAREEGTAAPGGCVHTRGRAPLFPQPGESPRRGGSGLGGAKRSDGERRAGC